eukprot:356003-Chlamydomonas_euryale.AAC.9
MAHASVRHGTAAAVQAWDGCGCAVSCQGCRRGHAPKRGSCRSESVMAPVSLSTHKHICSHSACASSRRRTYRVWPRGGPAGRGRGGLVREGAVPRAVGWEWCAPSSRSLSVASDDVAPTTAIEGPCWLRQRLALIAFHLAPRHAPPPSPFPFRALARVRSLCAPLVKMISLPCWRSCSARR